jgi:quercetin dioxygenase-like cupin family protein
MTRRWLAAALLGGGALAAVCISVGQVHAKNSTVSSVTVKTLAQGPVKSLPKGKVYVNILEFSQLPGADFGPHSHIPAVVYTLHGISTISFRGAGAQSVSPGEAAFIPALAVHTHENLEGRLGAGAIAAGLIVVVIFLCAATWLRGPRRSVTIAVLSLLLIGGGALALIGPTVDDYYLFAVRPEPSAVPMPRPDGRVVFSSPDVNPVPAAPYVETLSAITVPASASYQAPDAPGPEILVVVDGAAAVRVGGQTTHLGGGDADFAQTGQTVVIGNQGSGTLTVLDFAVTSTSTG